MPLTLPLVKVNTQANYESYKTASAINESKIYFVESTRRLYKGTSLFAGSVEIVTATLASITTGIEGKIYYSTTDNACGVCDGTIVRPFTPAIVSAIDSSTEAAKLANVGAIRSSLATAIGAGRPDTIVTALARGTDGTNDDSGAVVYDITVDDDGNEATSKLVFPFLRSVSYTNGVISVRANGASAPTTIDLGPAFVGASYNGSNGELSFTLANGTSSSVTLPVENFLASAAYNSSTHVLTMTLTDGSTVNADLSDLVTNVSVDATSATVALTLTNGVLGAAVKVSSTQTTNWVSAVADGLAVVPKVATASATYLTTTSNELGLNLGAIWTGDTEARVENVVEDAFAWEVIDQPSS
jgi:hypothetical protein